MSERCPHKKCSRTNFFSNKAHRKKARRRRSYLRRAAFEEQRSMGKNLQAQINRYTFGAAGFESKSSIVSRKAYEGTSCDKSGDRKSRILMKSVRISTSFSSIYQSPKKNFRLFRFGRKMPDKKRVCCKTRPYTAKSNLSST